MKFLHANTGPAELDASPRSPNTRSASPAAACSRPANDLGRPAWAPSRWLAAEIRPPRLPSDSTFRDIEWQPVPGEPLPKAAPTSFEVSAEDCAGGKTAANRALVFFNDLYITQKETREDPAGRRFPRMSDSSPPGRHPRPAGHQRQRPGRDRPPPMRRGHREASTSQFTTTSNTATCSARCAGRRHPRWPSRRGQHFLQRLRRYPRQNRLAADSRRRQRPLDDAGTNPSGSHLRRPESLPPGDDSAKFKGAPPAALVTPGSRTRAGRDA